MTTLQAWFALLPQLRMAWRESLDWSPRLLAPGDRRMVEEDWEYCGSNVPLHATVERSTLPRVTTRWPEN